MNTKIVTRFLSILSLVFFAFACQQTPAGTTIEGTIGGSDNLQVFVDEVIIGKANAVIGKTDISSGGKFSLNFPEGLDAGVYNLRIGAKRINLVLDGSEKEINVTADLATLQNYDVEISGSQDSKILADIMRGLLKREVSGEDMKTFVDTVSSPMVGAYVAFRSLNNNPDFMDTQKEAQAKLAKAYPDHEMSAEYANYLQVMEQQVAARRARERIAIGQPAPDIKLPSPDGKEYALSDLKGKVVLLDFWASWCGPCRRENPNVVAVYNKYKDQGFTIFSVSLDGVDGRTAARLGDEQKINDMKEQSKQRWVNAIAQDKLSWPYHVSDLKKWDAVPASMYGVRSIPRAFMIDREGNIVSTSVRGAQQIESELLKHL